MANKSFDFSTKGLKALEEYLNKYKNTLETKASTFVYRLAEIGLPIIEEKINESQTTADKSHDTYIKVTHIDGGTQATLILSGAQMVFIEFGAGVHYNGIVGSSPHPKGAELGFTIGSYGNGNGQYDTWFYYDENGNLIETYGTEATMPMFSASNEIELKMIRIAKEVFKNG